MTFIKAALALALVATLAVPTSASPMGNAWFPTVTWPDAAAPTNPDAAPNVGSETSK